MIIRVQVYERKDQQTVSYRSVNENLPGKWGAQQSDTKRDTRFFGLKKTPATAGVPPKRPYDFAWEERAINAWGRKKIDVGSGGWWWAIHRGSWLPWMGELWRYVICDSTYSCSMWVHSFVLSCDDFRATILLGIAYSCHLPGDVRSLRWAEGQTSWVT